MLGLSLQGPAGLLPELLLCCCSVLYWIVSILLLFKSVFIANTAGHYKISASTCDTREDTMRSYSIIWIAAIASNGKRRMDEWFRL